MASQQTTGSVALTEVSPQELQSVEGGHFVYFRFGGRNFFLPHRDFFRGFGRFRFLYATQILRFPFPFPILRRA